MIPRQPKSTIFQNTTLFRSSIEELSSQTTQLEGSSISNELTTETSPESGATGESTTEVGSPSTSEEITGSVSEYNGTSNISEEENITMVEMRSEEYTSVLQSHSEIV